MVPELTDSIHQVLTDLAAPGGPRDATAVVAALDGADHDALMALVTRHRLEGAVHAVLTELGRPVPDDLDEVIDDDRITRLLVEQALGHAASVFDAADIPWLTFKGPVISRLMARPETRTFNDLDLLVQAARFGDAVDALVDAGMTELNRNWEPYVRHRVGEVPMAWRGVSVDLHWHVVGLGRHRHTVRFDPTAMLDRRRTIEFGGRSVPTFDAEDQLLHLAMHSALAGAVRLDQLRDLAVVVGADPVDWDIVIDRARHAGVARLVGHALDRSARILDADVPAPVREALAGRSLRSRRRRDGGRTADLTSSAVVWRRDNLAATARAAAVRASERVLHPNGGWDFLDPESELFHDEATGGDEGRAEFLRRVANWA